MGAGDSKFMLFTPRIWTPSNSQKQASEITQTTRLLTIRMDAANAIDRRRGRLGVMNSSLTILVLFNAPLEAVQIRVEWFEPPLN